MSDAPRFGRTKPCCVRRAAASPDAMVCGECGSAILRCMAYKECGGLLDESGLCDVCISPSLFLDAGAKSTGKAGGSLALPLLFRNDSQIQRPLFITDVWVSEGGEDVRPQKKQWEELRAGESKTLNVQTAELRREGTQLFEVTFRAVTHYGRREEGFAFSAGLKLDVDSGGGVTINQTINAGGDNRTGSGDAFLINLNAPEDTRRAEVRAEPMRLDLVHADLFEKQQGIRGYKDGQLAGARLARDARFTFKGFGKDEATSSKPINSAESLLVAGRNALRQAAGGETDVRLLIRDQNGAVDEKTSLEISRRHVEFFLQNGRLYMNVAGGAGVILNNTKLPQDTIEALASGDVIRILPARPDAIALQVRMRPEGGKITEVIITRTPAVAGGG